MRTGDWLIIGALVLLFSGCASTNTTPTPEVRQTLAPTGRLRVGLFLENPLSVVRDLKSGVIRHRAGSHRRRQNQCRESA
jgi:hypothetical protein